MLKIKSILLVAFVLLGLMVSAQMPSPTAAVNSPKGGSIIGLVFDKDQHIAMQYTNVMLYHLPDSTMVNGTITEKDGSFKFSRVEDGNYYLKVHFIGFKVKTIGNIKIIRKDRIIKLPRIYLEPASATLGSVEVKARQSRVSYQIDKKVVDVSQDLTAAGGTAIDVLQNVPSVDVDLEGNVTLRGSSSFTVLIDGRPSVLTGSDALQQIPASAIKNIEIITNPSAKYDPEGVGGIINIIMKTEKKQGLNGLASTSVGTQNKYQGNLLLAYRKGKINYYVSLDGRHRPMIMKALLDNQTFSGDTTNYRISNLNGSRARKGYGLKGGMDIYFTKKSNLFLSAKVGGYGFESDNNSKINTYSLPATIDAYSNSISKSNRWGGYYNGQIDFLHKFNDLGHQIEALVYYAKRNGDDKESQDNYTTDANWTRLNTAPSSIQTNTYDTTSDLRIKVDYSLPIGEKGKLEAGLQSRFGNQNGEYTYMDYDTTTSKWVMNPNLNSLINFKRNIHAAYVSFKDSYNKFGYELGFRGEYTDRSVDSHDGSNIFIIKRFDYFPSAYFSYQFKHNYQVYTSYTRRIDRPSSWELNPFQMVIDPYNIRVGNPKLEPEYIDSYELGLQKAFSGSFVSLEGYYRIGKNKVTRILKLGSDGIMYHTRANLNKDYTLGLEAMANLKPAKWFGLNVTGTLYHYRLEGNVTGSDVSASSTNWSSRVTGTFNMKNNFRVQLMGVYRSPTATIQGSRKGFFYTNLALRKDFLKRKLNVTLSARDLLGTAKYDFISTGSNFYTHTTFQRAWPMISLNVSYFINNYKQKRTKPQENQNGTDEVGF